MRVKKLLKLAANEAATAAGVEIGTKLGEALGKRLAKHLKTKKSKAAKCCHCKSTEKEKSGEPEAAEE